MRIEFSLLHSLHGNLTWTSLPDTMQKITVVSHYHLRGPLHLAYLPSSLRHLEVCRTGHHSPIELTQLPSMMSRLLLSCNRLTESLDFTSLPHSLLYMSLSENLFREPVDLRHLPPTLRSLHLYDNELSGTPILGELPQCLLALNLRRNQFTGIIDLTSLSYHRIWKLPIPSRNSENSNGLFLDGNFFEGYISEDSLIPPCVVYQCQRKS